MTERTRIIAWWGYVLCVIVIFEVVFQLKGFAPAVGAALLSIVVLGATLKLIIGRLARKSRQTRGQMPDSAG